MEAKELGIVDCQKCGLCEDRDQIVISRGTGKIPLLVLGEAPGAMEDQTGIPFVGPSGDYLDQSFAEIGVNPEDVYITNVVKCRPPLNRPPHLSEILACRAYFKMQLEKIKPKVVLTLGYTALMSRSKLRYRTLGPALGKVLKHKDGYQLVPNYHPSFIIRLSGTNRFADLDRRFMEILKRAVDLALPKKGSS